MLPWHQPYLKMRKLQTIKISQSVCSNEYSGIKELIGASRGFNLTKVILPPMLIITYTMINLPRGQNFMTISSLTVTL